MHHIWALVIIECPLPILRHMQHKNYWARSKYSYLIGYMQELENKSSDTHIKCVCVCLSGDVLKMYHDGGWLSLHVEDTQHTWKYLYIFFISKKLINNL